MVMPLWLYDIVSAYPNALLQLPSMRDGKWNFHKEPLDPKVIEQTALGVNILSMFRVRWNFPTCSHKDSGAIPWFPFPYRTGRKTILFPSAGHAWITRDELVAAFKWARRFDCEDGIAVEEWDEFTRGK